MGWWLSRLSWRHRLGLLDRSSAIGALGGFSCCTEATMLAVKMTSPAFQMFTLLIAAFRILNLTPAIGLIYNFRNIRIAFLFKLWCSFYRARFLYLI